MTEEAKKTEACKEMLYKYSKKKTVGTYEQYINDVMEYLKAKFPGEDVAKVYEAAGFISQRTMVVVSDLAIERDREWKIAMRKLEQRTEKAMREPERFKWRRGE